jgi:hypothetical protein
MKRMHVHISVDNLDDSIRFYSAMFSAAPTVSKPDYAKWMLDDPRVNFAISQRGEQTGLNHLGIQVESGDELNDMQTRLESLQAGVKLDSEVACCYAKSDKYWVTDPQGIAWETFHTLANIPVFGESGNERGAKAACCIPLAVSKQDAASPCCVPAQTQLAGGSCC